MSHTGLNYAEYTKRVYHADLNCQLQAIILISRCPGSVLVSRLSTGLQFLRRQWKMPLRDAFPGVVAASMGNTKGVPRRAPQKSMLSINSVSVLCQVQFQRGNTQTASLVNTSWVAWSTAWWLPGVRTVSFSLQKLIEAVHVELDDLVRFFLSWSLWCRETWCREPVWCWEPSTLSCVSKCTSAVSYHKPLTHDLRCHVF